MSDVLKDKLKLLAEDDLMLKAIKHVFYIRIEKEEPGVSHSEDDTILGQKYRAYQQAKKIIDETLKDIEAYKEGKTETEIKNKGK